ncbi:4Fe-4S binding protein [Bacteroidota bacterium]
MNKDRREFIKNGCILTLGCSALSALPVLTGCVNNAVNPLSSFNIVEDICVGCGECLEYCFYDAIQLSVLTPYTINTDICIDCAKCVPICPESAFDIVQPDYIFNTEICIGCGDCIKECENEGNVITYEKEDYTVRGKCKPDKCRLECAAVCPEEAIIIPANGEKAIIDMTKCTRCGDCVPVCPFGAVNPAKVVKDDENCNHCSKCWQVCKYSVIQRVEPENYHTAKVKQDLCTSCGDCFTNDACPEYGAIERNINIAHIIEKSCRECGNCIESCRYDSIVEND